jgi:hypothetical protein
MAEGHQVPDGLRGRALVVDQDAVELGDGRSAVHGHHGESGGQVDVEPRQVLARGHDDQTVDAPGDQAPDQLAFALAVLVDARGHHHHSALTGSVLHRSEGLAAEAVGEVLHEHPDGRRALPATTQVAGRQVVAVAELVHGADHSP